ncbi:MAG: tRNA (adenosine(37)-N6)-dimethylallyltransferase MiaA [Clostridia bacterium]|nr:tRNA (adenosine(37)-N6)-dimethylallyltransferase MiaA [Clostridia bacterium]
MKPKVIVLAGPTASGKTALSLALAERFPFEIVSADSMQVYRGLDVATAKPSVSERRGVPHHMIDVASPSSPFTVSDYVKGALAAIRDIESRGHIPLIVGGTGFYIKALLEGADFEESERDRSVRAELEEFLAQNGEDALWKSLYEKDPARAEAIHPHNVKRVMRALELIRESGRKASDHSFYRAEPRFDSLYLVLSFSDRNALRSRIDARTDAMFRAGLCEEAERVFSLGLPSDATSLQAIGYKELREAGDLEKAAELIKLRTRQYAKKQITWFRAVKGAVFLDAAAPFEDLLSAASEKISFFLSTARDMGCG